MIDPDQNALRVTSRRLRRFGASLVIFASSALTASNVPAEPSPAGPSTTDTPAGAVPTATVAATATPSAATPPVPGASTAPANDGSAVGSLAELPPHRAVDPGALVAGDPLASTTHIRQAALARENRVFQPENLSRPEPGLRAGAIGILVRDPAGNPVAGQVVTLERVRESIDQGNTEDTLTTTTNAEGHAGFIDQNTDTAFRYEVLTRQGGALYSSGAFRLERQHGQLVLLNVFPTTEDIEKTFIVSRALYVVEPRDDVFQVQALYRFHNTNPLTWLPKDFRLALPPGAAAFRPGAPSGDLKLIEENRSVRISGTFSPGDHEVSFGYQVPNPGQSSARLSFPIPPHLIDVKIFVETSSKMGLSSPQLDAAQPTRGKNGQAALMVLRDFLAPGSGRPNELFVTITGLPTPGTGALLAALIALLVAGGGAYLALSAQRRSSDVALSDRLAARRLLLDELVLLEKAFRTEQIGPKTYEQTKRTLIDALSRLESPAAATKS